MVAEYDPKRYNYCRETVAIPPGTVVEECNFAQTDAGTAAILCDGPLVFRECNLINCLLDPRWTLEGCNTAQVRFVTKTDAKAAFEPAEVSRLQVLSEILTADEWAKIEPLITAPPTESTDTEFICSHPEQLVGKV